MRRAHPGKWFLAALAGAALLASCDAVQTQTQADAPSPELQAPSQAPDLTARRYAAIGEAEAITGPISVSETYRLGGPESGGGEATGGATILTLRTDGGLMAEAELVDVIDAGAQISGQTLRSLMDLPLDAVPALFRVTSETTPEGATSLCGARPASHIVTWEPSAAADPVFKILVTAGEAPGQAGAVLCQVLAYRREGA